MWNDGTSPDAAEQECLKKEKGGRIFFFIKFNFAPCFFSFLHEGKKVSFFPLSVGKPPFHFFRALEEGEVETEHATRFMAKNIKKLFFPSSSVSTFFSTFYI